MLADALWPDADGDSAYQSLTMALQRLRKLLNDKQTILLKRGMLTLNPMFCWVDIWTFESLLQNAHHAAGQLEKAIALYKGPYLKNEIDAAWVIPMQAKLHQKYLKAITRLATIYEDAGNLEKAIDYYEKGIEIDDLAENLYRNLMRCHAKLGCKPCVIAVFNRCRSVFKAKYNIEPSDKTIFLYRNLKHPMLN